MFNSSNSVTDFYTFFFISDIPIVNILSNAYTTQYGNDVTLECTVTADPLHTVVFWQKIVNGQPLSINLANSAKYVGSTVGTPSLTILSTNLDDPGQYRCSATNVVGTGQSQDTTLTVTGGTYLTCHQTYLLKIS